MTLRAIFYDLDGTLRMNRPNSWREFARFATEAGFDLSSVDLFQVARWEHAYFAESPELIADRVDFPERQAFWINVSRRELLALGADPHLALSLAPQLCQRMTEEYRPADLVPEDLPTTLETLKKAGYLLGVLSNRDQPYTDYLAELGLAEFFDLVIYAGEVGMHKPDPRVFHYLLEKAQVAAVEAVYVGDNYYADVVGARRVGLLPVLLDVHGVFESPDCPVIQSHAQIFPLLEPQG